MKRYILWEQAIGEQRAAIYEGQQCVELYVWRQSSHLHPRLGDEYGAVISSIDKNMGLVFLDMGAAIYGGLKLTAQKGLPHFHQGQHIEVCITREAFADKVAGARFLRLGHSKKLGRLKGGDLIGFLHQRFGSDIPIKLGRVDLIEAATERELHLPGGGSICIDFTRALVAIDVDKGSRATGFMASMQAINLIVREIRRRLIGGLIVIDFPNLRQNSQRETIMGQLEEAFSTDLQKVKIAPISRFGLVEISRARLGPGLDEVLNDRYGHPSVETQALQALRALEREGQVQGGARLRLSIPEAVYDWLQSGIIDWHAQLENRMGARFDIVQNSQFSISQMC